jgi:hypothetical protein
MEKEGLRFRPRLTSDSVRESDQEKNRRKEKPEHVV